MKYIPNLTKEDKNRFWSKVDVKKLDECWEWKNYSTHRGYGQFSIQHTNYYAHRIAYFLHNKKDPKELLVCHSCDNPACCNPKHLWLGTLSDDMRDMIIKRRGNKAKGSKHYRAKLTESQVRQIRKQYAKGGSSYYDLARQYGVKSSAIFKIVQRKTWKHI